LLDESLDAQRLVFVGAGAAAIGIARLVRAAMLREGVSEHVIRRALVQIDSRGMTFEGRTSLDDDKREFALGLDEMRHYAFESAEFHDLETVVRHVRPTVLIGTSGTRGAFTEPAIREMAAHAPTPIVMPLSNPTSKCEAKPADVIGWTDGRALVATGSPFDPVPYAGRTHVIGQANNAFIFPGVGMGAIVAEAREVTDGMFLAAARTLAALVSSERLAQGALYPNQSELPSVSRAIAVAVASEARDAGLGRAFRRVGVEEAIDEATWRPRYVPYRAG
jgi:malate dehydrogenase (oxaloacetate-decarboxylating)